MRLRREAIAFVAGIAVATAGVAAATSTSTSRPEKPSGLAHAARGGDQFFAGRAIVVPAASYGVPGVAYATAYCPRRMHAISGGWDSADNNTDVITETSSEPIRGLAGWFVAFHDLTDNTTSSGFVVRAVVLCH